MSITVHYKKRGRPSKQIQLAKEIVEKIAISPKFQEEVDKAIAQAYDNFLMNKHTGDATLIGYKNES